MGLFTQNVVYEENNYMFIHFVRFPVHRRSFCGRGGKGGREV